MNIPVGFKPKYNSVSVEKRTAPSGIAFTMIPARGEGAGVDVIPAPGSGLRGGAGASRSA
jgi:hypothetical protein